MKILPRSLLSVLAFLFLVAATSQWVYKQNPLKTTAILDSNTVSIDFDDYFNLSKVRDPSKLSFSATQIVGDEKHKLDVIQDSKNQSFATLDFAGQEIYFTKYLTERSSVLFSRSGRIFYLETNSNGLPLESHQRSFDLPFHDEYVFCNDAKVWGADFASLVILCAKESPSGYTNIWLVTLDIKDFKATHVLKKQVSAKSTGFIVSSRLALITLTAQGESGSSFDFVGVYNKYANLDVDLSAVAKVNQKHGKSEGVNRNNSNFLLFLWEENAFQFYKEVKMVSGYDKWDFASIKDYYFVDGNIVIVYKKDQYGDDEDYYFSSCPLNLSILSKEEENTIEVSCFGSKAKLPIYDGTVTQIEGTPYWLGVNQRSSSVIDLYVYFPAGKIDKPRTWQLLRQINQINVPDDLNSLLIRGVQGNLNFIAIQYANSDGFGSVNKFNDSSCLLIDIRTTGFFNESEMLVNEDHSGFVIGSVIYNQTQKDKFEISRFSGPWVNLLSESSPVQKTQSSFLELEVKEEGSNSVVMRAELKAQESPVRITVDPKTKLSTSTFGSQPKRLPLVNSFILSGNAVDYQITVESKLVDQIEVVHSNEIEVRFDDKPADEFESVLFTHSGAATVSKDGVFKIYDCSPVTNRNVCKSATQDEHKIDFDLVLSHAAFGNTQIQAYAFTKSPESEYPSTTIFYYFKSHGKVWKQMIEHSSLDVAFTNDIHGFLYFSAILKPSTGTIIPEIPIYKISPETPQEMVLFSKIDKKSLQISMDKEYCPTQLRPDPVFPTHLHVLSNCFHDHYFYSSPYIYTYDVAHREYLGKSLIDVSYSKNLKAQINFCPFSDSFVLHAPEQNSLVILPRVQSIQRLETSLAQLGFAKKSSFSCLSNLGSYAIFGQSLESSESNIYGIFSGGMGLNFEKFVNRIWRDFEPGSRHIPTTFTTARQVITVTHRSDENSAKFRVIQTLSGQPVVILHLNNLQDQKQDSLAQELTLQLRNKQSEVDIPFTLTTVKYSDKRLARVYSPWSEIEVAVGTEPQSLSQTDIDNSHALAVRSSLAAKIVKDKSLVLGSNIQFKEIFGDHNVGFGLTAPSSAGKSTLGFLLNGELKHTFNTPALSTLDFIVEEIQKDQISKEIVANVVSGHSQSVRIIELNTRSTPRIRVSEISSGARADKLRFRKFRDNQKIIAGLDSHTATLTVSTLQRKVMHRKAYLDADFSVLLKLEQIADFDIIKNDQEMFLIYILAHQEGVFSIRISQDDQHIIRLADPIKIELPTFIQKDFAYINCAENIVKQQVTCALNSAGVFLATFDTAFEALASHNPIQVNGELFEKLPGFDGASFVADEEYLVHRVINLSEDQSQSSFLNVYSRLQSGLNSAAQFQNLHTQIRLDNCDHSNSSLHEQLRLGLDLRQIESPTNHHLRTSSPFIFSKNNIKKTIGARTQDVSGFLDMYTLVPAVKLD